MHATGFIFVLALRAATAQLTPANDVQLQSVPLQLNSAQQEAASIAPRFRSQRAAPATHFEEPAPPQASPARYSEPTGSLRVREPQNIRPVAFQADGSTAAALLRHSLTPLGEASLPGRPVSLLSALESSGDRSRQLVIVKTYWKLVTRLGDYHWAVKESAFFASLPRPASPADAALLRAASTDAAAHEGETRLAAVAAQNELAELMRMPLGDAPLPRDLPLVTPYRTNFDAIFARRSAPDGLRRVARSLPIQFELIQQRADAVAAAGDSLQAFEQSFAQGQTSLSEILKAYERLSRQRMQFLSAVRDYNALIAEYSLSVVGSEVNRQTLVATLIRTSPTSAAPPIHRPAMASPAIRPTVGEQPYHQPAVMGEPIEQQPQFAPRFRAAEPANVAADPRWRTPSASAPGNYEPEPPTRGSVLQSPAVQEVAPVEIAPIPNEQPLPPQFNIGDRQ